MKTGGSCSRQGSAIPGAFTLIELLVVIAVICILASLLLPALRQARDSARIALCKSNQRNASVAEYAYASDFQQFPNVLNWTGLVNDDGTPIWPQAWDYAAEWTTVGGITLFRYAEAGA